MPVQFLSPEWTEELEKRLNASETFRAAASAANVTIQNVIETPDGAKRYWMRFEGGSVKLEAGDAEKADATIEQDYATAVALAKSELNPVSAFMTGKIRINGSMMLLMQLQGALSELAKEMQEIDVDY
ncbi:MAG TPA: SCP2 sterol-binding domain-containing protein [Actinomycetota bacterium]|jgi:putative sterol carrier protein|nr:SCP2 sterol-binding domain-containing protein [Actinomycetota bacterium]